MSRRAITIAAVAALLLLAGCSGGANTAGGGSAGGDGGSAALEATAGAGGGDGADAQSAASAADGAASASGSGASERVTAGADGRIVIRNGSVGLEVDDYAAARANLTRAVERRGGYVSDATERNRRYGNLTRTTGRVVLRVPKGNFSGLVDAVRAEGEVLEVTTGTRDVTDRVVDLRARLRNLRAERDRLRTLYAEANDTEAVLKVGERLSDVQGEIERVEARLGALEDRVAYSTLAVELREPHPDPDAYRTHERWYDTPVVTAFLDSVDGVTVAARAAAVGFAYALPYLVVFGVPVALVGGLLVRRHR